MMPMNHCLRAITQAAQLLAVLVFLSGFGLPLCAAADVEVPVVDQTTAGPPVTLTDRAGEWTLDNGIVRVMIDKKKCGITSMRYKGQEVMGPGGRWSHTPYDLVKATVTIDPKPIGGSGAEVSIKGKADKMDVEIRYALVRGASGIYTYSIYTHPARYPTTGFGESRFLVQLTPRFDWLSVDADRNMPMVKGEDLGTGVVIHAKEQRILSSGLYKNSVEHKYSYCARMYELPAYGWSSIDDHLGVWFINPSNEYLGGGPTRLDLVCHMGATILDYWTSGHYGGGAGCNIAAGQEWNKVVGPIFVYCNSLKSAQTATAADLNTFKATEGNPTIPAAWTANANALFQDALAQAKVTQAKWPFPWVRGVDYPQAAQRGTVTGQLVLNDPQAASTSLPHLRIGLTHPDFHGPDSDFVKRSGNGTKVTWEHDAVYYQFWTVGSEDGKFTIPNVRPGIYTLHAFADNVLGEYAKLNITVGAGQSLDLGKLEWKPERYGQQIWEIGYPDRTGCKFFKGDGANYWRWGWGLRYSLLFPNDITYTVGKSDYRKDWFFQQVPHSETKVWVNPEAKDPANQPFGWVKAESLARYPQSNERGPWQVYGQGRATTWKIKFTMPKDGLGLASLRVALAGADGGGGLGVAVNGRAVGIIHTVSTNALRYNTAMGIWRQYNQPFDATLLKAGENEIQLNVPAGDLTSGVVYDYLRLEVDEGGRPGVRSQ